MYNLRTYYCNFWLLLNVPRVQNIDELTCACYTFGMAWIRSSLIMQLTIDVGVFEHLCWQMVDTLTKYYDSVKYPRSHMIRNVSYLSNIMRLLSYRPIFVIFNKFELLTSRVSAATRLSLGGKCYIDFMKNLTDLPDMTKLPSPS